MTKSFCDAWFVAVYHLDSVAILILYYLKLNLNLDPPMKK